MKNFDKMTNKQLQEYCEINNIRVDSKNVSKPTKSEYILAISEHEAGLSIVDKIDDVIDESLIQDTTIDNDSDLGDFFDNNDNVKPERVKKKVMTRAEKRKKQYAELMPLRRVIINSNDNNQTRTKNQVEFCTWGNRLLGHYTDKFILGRPWHVHEGALRNLEGKQIRVPIQDDEGNTVRFEVMPAYIVQRLDNLSQDEIDVIAKRQTIRNNSIDNLV
jgi:hypothetical protein